MGRQSPSSLARREGCCLILTLPFSLSGHFIHRLLWAHKIRSLNKLNSKVQK